MKELAEIFLLVIIGGPFVAAIGGMWYARRYPYRCSDCGKRLKAFELCSRCPDTPWK